MRIMLIIPVSKQSVNIGALDSAPACFSCHRASETQVELLLKEINVRKSPGHDMIPSNWTEETASVIARMIIRSRVSLSFIV